MRRWLDALVIVLVAAAVFGWNVHRFVEAEPRPRIKEELEFLPDPKVARMLALGQPATVGKLMLIDSYPYFQFQMDKRDDSMGDDDVRGGFQRLYETLIELDPNFIEFYLKGGTAVGGVVEDPRGEISILQRGLLHHPQNTRLWMYLLSVLDVNFRLGERNPDLLLAILEQWRQAELASGQGRERLPGDWLRSVRARRDLGIAELSYWGQQLWHLQDNPDTPQARVILSNMREVLSRRQGYRLQALVEAFTAAEGEPPATLADALRTDLIESVYELPSDALHPSQPFHRSEAGDWMLRRDAFGHAWELRDGRVVSPGAEREEFQAVLARWNETYRQAVRASGRWAADLDEAITMAGADPGRVPPGGELRRGDGRLLVVYGDRDAVEPWTIAELLAAAGMGTG